jgi:hypothetical protein
VVIVAVAAEVEGVPKSDDGVFTTTFLLLNPAPLLLPLLVRRRSEDVDNPIDAPTTPPTPPPPPPIDASSSVPVVLRRLVLASKDLPKEE